MALLLLFFFGLRIIASGHLAVGGAQTSGISRVSFINAFRSFGDISGQVFHSGNRSGCIWDYYSVCSYHIDLKTSNVKHNLEAPPP